MCSLKMLSSNYANQLANMHEEAFDAGWPAADFQTHIENEYDDVLGAMENDEVCGFVVIRTQANQSEILTIVVAQKHRTHGLGKKLLKQAEQTASQRGSDIMFLEVAADNPVAKTLYLKAGYHSCGVRKGYYRRSKGRVAALLFQKRL